jgi:glycogen operon protein
MLRFVRELIALRKRHPSLQRRRFLSGQPKNGSRALDIIWRGPDGGPPRWDDPHCRTLAFTLAGTDEDEEDLQVLINMGDDDQTFQLEGGDERAWHLAVNTALAAPQDVAAPGEKRVWSKGEYLVAARSLVVLEGR